MTTQMQNEQKSFIITSVLYVIVGIVLMVWPNMSMELLGRVAGICMMALGLTHIIIYFTKDHMLTILQQDLTIGVILAACGAFILMHQDFVTVAIPFAIGIILLIGALMKVQYALDMRRLRMERAWSFILFFAIVLGILGIVLLANPFGEKVLVYYIACSVILDGVLNIFCVLAIAHRLKRINKGKVPGMQVPQNAGFGFTPTHQANVQAPDVSMQTSQAVSPMQTQTTENMVSPESGDLVVRDEKNIFER